MTRNEFVAAQRIAREKWLDLYKNMDKEIAKVYIEAADQIADRLKTLELNNKKDSLTYKSQKALESELRKTGNKIAGKSEEIIIDGIVDQTTITSKAHIIYIKDAIDISKTKKISINKIENLYNKLNKTLIEITYARLSQDGYTFSERIWGFSGDTLKKLKLGIPQYWERDIKNVINTGFAQGRDIFKIAQDIQTYAKDGKIKLAKRYGPLERGTAKFYNRIPKNIDWRALRIARSELYNSIQQAARLQGKLNPAVKSDSPNYIWNLTSGSVHSCICPDLAANSPYTEMEVPDFPHPNCLCYITIKIMSRDEFVNDLIDWGNGANVPYLDSWFQSNYF